MGAQDYGAAIRGDKGQSMHAERWAQSIVFTDKNHLANSMGAKAYNVEGNFDSSLLVSTLVLMLLSSDSDSKREKKMVGIGATPSIRRFQVVINQSRVGFCTERAPACKIDTTSSWE